jgi:hypothetical protein
MLLLVMEADLEDAHHLGQLRFVGASEQAFYSLVDMGAKRGDLFAIRPRDEPALGPRVARPSRHIVRVEEIGEPLIEDAIAGKMRPQEKLLEEPGRMRAAPLSAEDHLARRSVSARTARNASRQVIRGSVGVARGIVSVSPSSRRRRRTGDEVAGGMPIPGLAKSRDVR